MNSFLFPRHLNADCITMILALLDSHALLNLTLVSRSTRLVALPALLYRVKLRGDGFETPKLLSFRTSVCAHSLGHHVRHFSYDRCLQDRNINNSDAILALKDIFQVCFRMVTLTLCQQSDKFFVDDPRLAPALLSLQSLVDLRLIGIGVVGIHAIRQIRGLRYLTLCDNITLCDNKICGPVHSPDVSHIILGLADTLEELVLSGVIPDWHALWEQSKTDQIVCRNVKKLILMPLSPSPKYLAHIFPNVRFLWIRNYADYDELEPLPDESTSLSHLWPALTSVKCTMDAATKLASHCPSLQTIIILASNPPLIPHAMAFLKSIPMDRIVSISLPLFTIVLPKTLRQAADQLIPILTKLSIDAINLQFLCLSIHTQGWSHDDTDDIPNLALYLPIPQLARLRDLRYLFIYFRVARYTQMMPLQYAEASNETTTAAALALDIMGHLPDLEYFELGQGYGIVEGLWYEALVPRSLRSDDTILWKRDRGTRPEDVRVERVWDHDEWARARALYEHI